MVYKVGRIVRIHMESCPRNDKKNLSFFPGFNIFPLCYAIIFSWMTTLVTVQGDVSTVLLPTPTISISLNTNASFGNSSNATGHGNSSTIQPNTTYVLPSVVPTIISHVSNDTATAENVFFLEFKLISKQWTSELIKKSATFIKLANEITTKIDEVYSSRNDTWYNGSLVLGYREGIYVSVKIVYKRGVTVNVSLVDPLIEYFRAGGSDGLLTDTVFIKLSKYADCVITYVDTRLCFCPTRTYRKQIKCAEPDVIGGDVCPHKCYTGYQMTGTTPCTWDDLDAFRCSAELSQPALITFLLTFLLLYMLNI